ncbi:MAG: hypothetical protein WKF84_06035 [Pyrinomonadaceae bacterium]
MSCSQWHTGESTARALRQPGQHHSQSAAQRAAPPLRLCEHLCEDITRHLERQPIPSLPYAPSLANHNGGTLFGERASQETSIAVLPLKVLSLPARGETGDDYLGLGLADSLITRLSKIQRIIVRPTNAVVRYSGMESDAVAAGLELGVDFVLDGRILKAGERIRVTVQLLSVADGATVWAEQFDGQLDNVLQLQDEFRRGPARRSFRSSPKMNGSA